MNGDFIGHVVPGTFFILFSIWHAIKTIDQYFRCKASNGMVKFKARTYYTYKCCGQRFPLESILKVVSVVTGIASETGFLAWRGELLHITMYSFFGLVGIVEICHFYKFQLPPSMCYMSYVLAFGIEDILFYWHTTGWKPMDSQIHMLLVYTGVGVCIVIILQMFRHDCVQVSLCATYLVLLHGLWFYAIAFILYGDYVGWQVWDESRINMMQAIVLFSALAAWALFIMTVIWCGIVFKYRCQRYFCYSGSGIPSRTGLKNMEYSGLGRDEEDLKLRSPEESFN